MPACPTCGTENPTEARFCMSCASPLAAQGGAAREQRKVVTILFCDLVGSTALGESTDPEALRARMRRYFEDLRVILERHGGTVEKFVGDAVMAVFGIPVSHEDDALRAVRAASEMQTAISEHGLEARIGINTGEVVVGGEGETLVTGDAVNVAARLEQAAGAGAVFIGAETHSLVRDAVRVEAVEPLVLKGKADSVGAFSLLEVLLESEGLARNPEALLVGRKRERNRLWRDFEDVLEESSCRLVTLLGPAGIGKSRLVADFVERVGTSADILRGRCLSYGEGITYWPLVEILIAIGVEPDSVIGTSPPETQLAFRRLLEARAAKRPQVVVVDDLQWAEPVFIDLVEHVADLSRDAPIFLLCVARTELLDIRPDWGGGKMNATSILLEPLAEDECEALIGNLLGDSQLGDDLRDRIMSASAGNPLYVEEMLAMVREHGGDGEIVVPPTIHALLQARIDSLDGDVRVVMERGSVEGEVFHRGAVAELSPSLVRGDVESHLTTLVRKELIRSTSSTFPQDEGYRFRHLLIRDAAYESLPKATRAELHEQFADWLSTHDLVERDEIVGYHLEQAHRYRYELDPADPSLAALANRASERLRDSGRAALKRGDHTAGRTLLGRAVSIVPQTDPRREALAPELAIALWEAGDLESASDVLRVATSAADPVVRALAVVVAGLIDSLTDLSTFERSHLEDARRVLERAGHHEGLSIYWRCVAVKPWNEMHALDAIAALEQGLHHLRRAETYGLTADFVWWIRAAYLHGPTPVAVALERSAALDEIVSRSVLGEADAAAQRARLVAMGGDIEESRELLRSVRETFHAAGMALKATMVDYFAAFVERRAADVDGREQALRRNLAELRRLDVQSYASTTAAELAVCLYEQGRVDEVRELSVLVRARSAPHDLVNFIYVDALDGCLLAREGRAAQALELGGRALKLANSTDFFSIRFEARALVAEISDLCGLDDEARTLATEAVEIAVAKGDVTGAARARERFAELGIEVA